MSNRTARLRTVIQQLISGVTFDVFFKNVVHEGRIIMKLIATAPPIKKKQCTILNKRYILYSPLIYTFYSYLILDRA